ncbi:substrate-binding domain-containing protein [Tychonema sp. BBK16]|uniref:substrate-binding domain-containing protein n=1 Tax=Tychonema sp. BBK16 TaxID=2699888 RepID=UPI001F2E1E86|nr:substrate-binding domain-containing protein [Tychonema sp. BBK16]MCF6371903.1 substrate-binding domain-containing protein [Tychonema sp. BBK16]
MKQNLVILALSAIALLGLPSCKTTSDSVPTTIVPKTVAKSTETSIKLGASSSTLGLIKVLQTNYEATAKNVKITQLEPGKSENIIDGIKVRLVDIAAISQILKPGDNDGNLESLEVAHDALVVATHSSVTGVKNLTTEDMKGIYSGTITNWQQLGGTDAKIVLLDRPEDESAKRLLRKYYLGNDLKSSSEAVVFRKEGELIEAIQSTPYSIGIFSLAHAISHKLLVNRLSLNEVKPTQENVKAGKYPMVRTISIVWHKNPTEATKGLIRYISSPSAMNAMEQSGFISVAKSAKN